MKLSNQSYLQYPPVQPLAVTALTAAESPRGAAFDSKTELDPNKNNEFCTAYPVASDNEIRDRNERSYKFRSRYKERSKPEAPSKPKEPKTPEGSAKPEGTGTLKKYPGGENGAADAASKAKVIHELHDKNAFPPISSELASSARRSFVTAGVSTLINIPFNVTEYMASKTITDRIDAHSRMPGAEITKPDGTKTTVDPSATEQQIMEARLESSEIKIELMVNDILSINEGPDAKAVGKAPGAPTDIKGRLSNTEKVMDVVENQMKDAAKRYGLIYAPFVVAGPAETCTDQDRMGNIENRYNHMNKMMKRLINNAKADVEDEK